MYIVIGNGNEKKLHQLYLTVIDHFSDIPGKVAHAERFLDEMHPFLKHSAMDDDV
jgi:hypothetical protein